MQIESILCSNECVKCNVKIENVKIENVKIENDKRKYIYW
jgi:hypothetical protein